MSHPALHLRLRLWAIGYALASICGAASAQTAVTPHCGMDSRTKAVGEPISLGAVVGKTGPDDFSGSADAAMAYFRCVNDNGGIHGRPIQYFVMDDQWSPEKAIQAASTLLQDRKVLALVGSTSFVECSANAQRYAESGAMVVAGTGVPRDCFYAKNYVPVNSGPRVSSTIASMFMVQKYQAKSVVCIIPNVPGLVDWACHGAQQWGARHKVKVTIVPIDPGSFDASKVMQSVAQTQPDVIVMNLPKGILIPMMAASAKLDLGKSIRFASSAPAYNTDVAKALGPYWKDRFWVNLEFQPIDLVAPDMQNWRAVLDRYGPRGHSLDAFSQGGYLAARMVTQVLLTMEPANLDRARLSEALRKVTDFQSDILCKAFYVGGGKRHNANSSGPMAVYTGTGWLLASASCISADDPELVDMRAEERKLKIH